MSLKTDVAGLQQRNYDRSNASSSGGVVIPKCVDTVPNHDHLVNACATSHLVKSTKKKKMCITNSTKGETNGGTKTLVDDESETQSANEVSIYASRFLFIFIFYFLSIFATKNGFFKKDDDCWDDDKRNKRIFYNIYIYFFFFGNGDGYMTGRGLPASAQPISRFSPGTEVANEMKTYAS